MNGVVLLGDKSKTTEYVANALANGGVLSAIIVEDPASRKKMLKYRMKRLGVRKVVGQLLFMVFAKAFLRNNGRICELEQEFELKSGIPNGIDIHSVTSVNSKACRELLRALSPSLVVVNGTRIISNRVLNCTDAKFINTHVGVTPRYRGVHGGYWALAEGNKELFGTTVHYVDSGVDTGGILIQKTGSPSPKDDFSSYPVLQYGLIVGDLVRTVKMLLRGEQPAYVVSQDLTSRQYFHPTLGYYLWRRLRAGVK